MTVTAEKDHARNPAAFEVKLADREEEIREAMRLRYRVFVEEEGNRSLENREGLEKDLYDPFCDHLIVRDRAAGKIVGTYRLLPGDRALQNIGFYSETEFDLGAFQSCKKRTLELGRSCIDPDYRGGKVIQLLWEGIARYLSGKPYTHLIGCASVPFRTREELNEVYSLLCLKKIIRYDYGIVPRETHRIDGLARIPVADREKRVFRKLPPLMKGYQWLGAEIGGDPAFDPLFGTVDFFIILEIGKVTARYSRKFLG